MEYYRRQSNIRETPAIQTQTPVILNASNALYSQQRVATAPTIIRAQQPQVLVQQYQQPAAFQRPLNVNMSSSYADHHIKELPAPCQLCSTGFQAGGHHHHGAAVVGIGEGYKNYSVKYNSQAQDNSAVLQQLQAQKVLLQSQLEQIIQAQRDNQAKIDAIMEQNQQMRDFPVYPSQQNLQPIQMMESRRSYGLLLCKFS